MQFSVVAVLATLASFTAATSTSTVYACESTTVAATGTGASTGAVIAPTATYSPIAYATGAASMNKISGSALGLVVAGGVALLL